MTARLLQSVLDQRSAALGCIYDKVPKSILQNGKLRQNMFSPQTRVISPSRHPIWGLVAKITKYTFCMVAFCSFHSASPHVEKLPYNKSIYDKSGGCLFFFSFLSLDLVRISGDRQRRFRLLKSGQKLFIAVRVRVCSLSKGYRRLFIWVR